MYLVNTKEMQYLDRSTIEVFGLPGRILMENAGRGAVAVLMKHFPEVGRATVGIMAGSGNNAGDGFVMARLLAGRGIRVVVFMLADAARLHGDAAANLALLPAMGVVQTPVTTPEAWRAQQQALHQVDLWVDAMFGTGLNAPVRGLYHEAIAHINASGKPVLAVDLPSGLSADSGQVLGAAVKARVTVTFAFAKLGHYLLPGAEYTGKLEVVDIGIPLHVVAAGPPRHYLITAETAAPGRRPRPLDAHKGSSGHVLVLAGGVGKSGAAVLTTQAALRSGAGLVTLALPASVYPIAAAQVLEAMTLPLPESTNGLAPDVPDLILEQCKGKQVLAIGPGLGTAPRTAELVRTIIRQTGLPLVLDADALNIIAGHPDVLENRATPVVLTPHPGEAARLLNTTAAAIQADRPAAARHLAAMGNAVVVLKGARTLVAIPDGRLWLNPAGNPGLASGGMGDALTGIIAGLIAQGATPLQAARCGVFLHAAAADALAHTCGPQGWLASDLVQYLPRIDL